jgi:hypothetical protein
MSEMGDSGSAVESPETVAVPGEGEPASDGYDIGGPELEAEIAKMQGLQAGNEVANSGGSGEAGATGGAKAGGANRASGDGEAGAGQEATAESGAEAGGEGGGEAPAAVPGEGEPGVPPVSDGYFIGGPEVEKEIAMQELQKGLAARLNDPDTQGQFPDGYDPSHGGTQEQYPDKDASREEISSIATPYGPAEQSNAEAAISARAGVEAGRTLYRIGKLGESHAGEAQFWALEHPTTPGFASRHGIPPENVSNYDFVEQGHLGEGVPFITRAAPAVGTNLGEAIEVVVPPGGVRLNGFSYLGERGLEP